MTADLSATLTSEIVRQGVIVVIFAVALYLGYKRVWLFSSTHQDIRTGDLAVIAALRERLGEKDKVIEFQQAAYEARLREKEEECDRIATRLVKSESQTDRLINAAIDATTQATRAVRVVTEKDARP